MRITQLTSENVKRIQAVSITPDGNVVRITGRNGQGKTSVLDSIAMVFSGGDAIPAMPIRKGSKSAKIVATTDDGLTVTRSFTPNGTYLSVTSKDGAKFPSPQAMLDKIVGRLTFDPLAFARQQPKQQVETLKVLVGLDFSAMDKKRADLYDERTAVNRTTKQLEGQAAGMKRHADAPKAEVVVADLVAELEAAQRTNAANAEKRRAAEKLAEDIGTGTERLAILNEQLKAIGTSLGAAILEVGETLERRIDELRREAAQKVKGLEAKAASDREALAAKLTTGDVWLKQAGTKRDALAAEVANLVDADPEPIRVRIGEAELTNRMVRENRAAKELADEIAGSARESARITAQIEQIDADKQAQLSAAKFPVPGMSFDEGGVVLNGIPFEQASSAEQLRVSVAMGLALNPKLKVLLIRDGSLLDAERMTVIGEMADAADAQIWIERVADGSECGIVIEDGMVAEATEGVPA